jgi:hypothetical protein
MSEVKPGWTFVVEVGKCALRELLGCFVVRWNETRVTNGADAMLVRNSETFIRKVLRV